MLGLLFTVTFVMFSFSFQISLEGMKKLILSSQSYISLPFFFIVRDKVATSLGNCTYMGGLPGELCHSFVHIVMLLKASICRIIFFHIELCSLKLKISLSPESFAHHKNKKKNYHFKIIK